MKHTPSRVLESEKLLEKFSYLVFNFSLIFFEDSYDQLEQLHLIVTNEEEKFSPHDDVMISWNHYFALLDSNFDLTEHDIEDTILFLGSKSTKTLERVRFKEGFRVIPSWFSE